MKKLKIYIVLASVGLVSTQCSDNFLDVANPNQIDEKNFFTKMQDLELALTAVYSAQTTRELYGRDFVPKALYGLAHTADQEWIADNAWNQLYQNNVTPENGLVRDFWRSWYRIIARANDFLTQSDQFAAGTELSEEEQERVSQMKGEAHFQRGLAYFHLIRLWGEDSPARNGSTRGVPLILEVPETREDMFVPRASVAEVYQQIVNDFKEAEQRLPDSWSGENIARVDRYAAKGFLGKTYLYQENWEMARGYFEEVISSGAFSLEPYDAYDALFRGTNEFSPESLYELNFSVDMQERAGGTGTLTSLVMAPKGSGWSNVYPHDKNVQRFGDDPRLRIAALEPGVDSVFDNKGAKIPLQVYVGDDGALGWSFRKYVPLDHSVYSTNLTHGANLIMMRLADVYLMYAEVLQAQGNDVEALEYMNKVRRRAHGFSPDTPEPSADLMGLSGIQLRDAIREERFLELFAEGHRWYDLQRWGIVEDELAAYGKVRSGTINYAPRDNYLPIPQQELEANDQLEQSEGY
ncbi:RagB/SusD family nutrient uptake outer membrane protein [Parapedobacter tibetensis]|uniref:RagB/SusD family nutrient uptake outer membrane protein n=1 Tax=Parapedobacter tibetensis TaxID=2972951 RepID=UPI00214DC768|nr:RagB/SusD family nutrient uptake outer membrane protein [Parapedobacter tibetensis]